MLAFRPEDVEVTVSQLERAGRSACEHGGYAGSGAAPSDRLRTTACEERSQLQNRRLALARLAAKLAERNAASLAGLEAEAWRGHRELERGNPAFVIRGRELWDLERFGETVFFQVNSRSFHRGGGGRRRRFVLLRFSATFQGGRGVIWKNAGR